jgi:hypothetical protein
LSELWFPFHKPTVFPKGSKVAWKLPVSRFWFLSFPLPVLHSHFFEGFFSRRSRSPCFDSLIWVKWSINPTNFWCEAVTSYWQWKTREGIRRISFQWQCTCFVNPCLNLRVFSMFLI